MSPSGYAGVMRLQQNVPPMKRNTAHMRVETGDRKIPLLAAVTKRTNIKRADSTYAGYSERAALNFLLA